LAIIAFISEIVAAREQNIKQKVERLQQLEKLVAEQNEIIQESIRNEAFQEDLGNLKEITEQSVIEDIEIDSDSHELSASSNAITTLVEVHSYNEVREQEESHQQVSAALGDSLEVITMIE